MVIRFFAINVIYGTFVKFKIYFGYPENNSYLLISALYERPGQSE